MIDSQTSKPPRGKRKIGGFPIRFGRPPIVFSFDFGTYPTWFREGSGMIPGCVLAVLGDGARVDVDDRFFGYLGQLPGLFGSEPEGLRDLIGPDSD